MDILRCGAIHSILTLTAASTDASRLLILNNASDSLVEYGDRCSDINSEYRECLLTTASLLDRPRTTSDMDMACRFRNESIRCFRGFAATNNCEPSSIDLSLDTICQAGNAFGDYLECTTGATSRRSALKCRSAFNTVHQPVDDDLDLYCGDLNAYANCRIITLSLDCSQEVADVELAMTSIAADVQSLGASDECAISIIRGLHFLRVGGNPSHWLLFWHPYHPNGWVEP
uniref:Uncharacterized protein n=1 Tax=Capitella teleta TaxID=283909 RepID=X1ZRJ6_CAPTE